MTRGKLILVTGGSGKSKWIEELSAGWPACYVYRWLRQPLSSVPSEVVQFLDWPTFEVGPKFNLRHDADAWHVDRIRASACAMPAGDAAARWMGRADVFMGAGAGLAFSLFSAGLTTQPGHMLIVDKPETFQPAHVQSAMGDFLACIAVAGATVVCETHSTLILKRVRTVVTLMPEIASMIEIVHLVAGAPVALTFGDRDAEYSWPPTFMAVGMEDDYATICGRRKG